MNILKRFMAIALVLCMLGGLMPMTAFATGTEDTDSTVTDSNEDISLMKAEVTETADTKAANTSEFIRAFALDCGRIYFSVDDIKEIIDVMAANDYTHLTLAFGNSGFRFLLDDMSISSYSSDDVKTAILAGNNNYVANDGHNGSSAANTCLSQADMDAIISYANSKGIEIIPALNSPGHMNTIVYAMGQMGITNAGYPVTNFYNSESTININNDDVKTFVSELLQKYITYFKNKGCTMFNLGADEFANDPTDNEKLPGFTSMSTVLKNSFIGYVNSAATMVSNAGMIPMMFNDGYAWSDANFNKDIIVCYWTSGSVSSTDIANAGHKVINNSQNYYYVLGEPFGTASSNWCSYASATNGVNNVPVTQMIDGENPGSNLVGSQMWLWCDYTDETYTAEEEAKVHTLISALAENNPTYFTIPEEPAEPENRTITMMVNQTVTDTIEGNVYTDYEVEDTSIVSVDLDEIPGVTESTVSTTPATTLEDGATYILRIADSNLALSKNKSNSKNFPEGLALEENKLTADANHLWTLEAYGDGYKLKNADGYLELDYESASINNIGEVFNFKFDEWYKEWIIVDDAGFAFNALGGLNNYSLGGWSVYENPLAMQLYKVTTATEASTEVSFTGNKVGTTTVTVGNVNYTINVIAENLSKVALKYNPWLSNYSVHKEGTGAGNCYESLGVPNTQEISATSSGVYSEDGAVFSELVWATGDWRWEEGAQTVFWKGTILDEKHKQEGNGTNDMCMSGTDFTYIRYWEGVWSCSADRATWIEVKNTDEVCAYYLQETDVTAEVETFVKDWAFTPDNASGRDESRYQKALSFAAVYPGGTMNPSEKNIYNSSTLIYWDNLADLGFIRFGVNEEYEIEKITYTFGERANKYGSRNWTENDSINWKKTTIGDVTWYDETVCWDESYGTEPVVNGANLSKEIYAGNAGSHYGGESTYYNGTWGADDAVLILIYLKPVATEDSLNVVYYDEKFGEKLYEYPIIVPSERDFTNGIGKVVTNGDGSVTVDTNQKPSTGTVTDHPDRIDVTGYGMENNVPAVQQFQTDLTKVPDAIGKYNSELYKYTGSKISEDGKTLYLYYSIDTTVLSPHYVVDFGLPITFNLTELLGEGTEVKDVTAVEVVSARYGTLEYDEDSKEFTYTPTKILQGIDVLSIALTMQGKTNTTNVGVTPATTVHYEESFIEWDSNWSGGNAAITVGNQTVEKMGAKVHNFGYDPAYASVTGASNGTEATASAIGAKGTFTFTGNGIQIFADSTDSTGKVSVQVKNDDGKIVNISIVDTVVDPGKTGATTGQTGEHNGLPIVSLIDLQKMPHDTYTVTITKVMDTKPVNIDGIRVFNTVEDSSVFTEDLEDNPNFYEMRDAVLHAIGVAEDTSVDYTTMYEQVYNKVADAKALITDEEVTYAKSETIQDLLDNGPKNEIYIYAGQTLNFKVSTNRVMQIGMKAPQGATNVSVKVNGEDKAIPETIGTSVDMFYTLANKAEAETEYTVQIKNEGSAILSITELKICDDPNAAFVPFTVDEIKEIMCGETAEEPTITYADATLNISLNDAASNVLATTALTANGVVGETYTFSAAEIKEAVETLIPEGYELKDASYANQEVAYGEEATVSFEVKEVKEEKPESIIVTVVKTVVKTVVNTVKKIINSIFSWF